MNSTAAAPSVTLNQNPCSNCGNALDTTGYPHWCKKCRAANKRQYEATRKEMTESRGFAAGVSAMRDYLMKNFGQYGTQGSFSGIEIAEIIRRCKGPADVD